MNDTGGEFLIGPCATCGQVFAHHPDRVPSIHIDPATGMPPTADDDIATIDRSPRAPICPTCVATIIEARTDRGITPHDPWNGQHG